MESAPANSRPPDFLVNMSASADVLAQAKVEIDLAAIPEGKNVCLPAPPTRSPPPNGY
jgi:ubiquinol-cytochrome c reductase iron-sulfur subunit